MPSQLRNAILALSPYLYWPLDELSGLTAVDLSGNGRNGTYSAAIQQGIDGVPGDGATGITLFPQPGASPFKRITRAGVTPSAQQSLMVFFRNHVSAFGASETMFSWTDGGTNGHFLQFDSASQSLHEGIGAFPGYVVIADPQNLGDFANHWNVAVWTEDTSIPRWSLYVNGALRAQATVAASHSDSMTQPFTIGCLSQTAGQTQPYTGDLAHVAYFHSELQYSDVLSLYTAAGISVPATGNITTAATAGAIPTSYTLGTAVTGLTGSGTIAVPNLYGAWVQLTSIPASVGHSWETPTRHIPGQGRIMWSDLNGDDAGSLIHMDSQLVWAPNRTNLLLRYSFRPGVVATITPITI